MLSKEITRETINKVVKNVNVGSDFIKIVSENESIVIKGYHRQDCCENVYADFSVFEYQKDEIMEREVKDIVFKGVEGIGFIICFYYDWEKSTKVLVPCYNEQNGYYSDELKLVIIREEESKEIDISNFVEEIID